MHDGTIPWRALLAEAQQRLSGVVEQPDVDARRIVEEASGFEGAEFFLSLDELVSNRGIAHFDSMVTRRLAGEPLQYVLGRWGFRRLDLKVDARVLIPRPETEGVVDVVLAEIDRLAATQIADLGTGSGAIALSLALERDDLDIWATDVSPDALLVARGNLAGIGSAATRVRLSEGSWFAALPDDLAGSFDVIVSNPPYVSPHDHLPDGVARWEPNIALVAEDDGFAAIAHLLAEAHRWLRPVSSVVMEIGESQADRALELAASAGFQADVLPDLAGRPRTLLARRS